MLQQVMVSPGNIEFIETNCPVPNDDQILIRIRRIGICGSDIHVYHGKHPFTKYPVTQGHEVSGEIVSVGKNLSGWRIGQKVTIEPQVVCGECYPCRHGKYNLCENLKVMGFQTTGTASEYVVMDEKHVTPLPDEMSFDEGAMIEPLAVTVHAANQAGFVEGQNIWVIGAGPIGILLMQSLKAKGAACVFMTDISDTRLEIAKECGADHVFNTANDDPEEEVLRIFGPDKPDLIYDCAGNNTSIGQAIRIARKGSMIILVAVFSSMASVDLAVLNDHELDLNTTMMYRHPDYLEAIEMVRQGKVHLQPLMSKHFPFRHFLDAYRYIDNNREKTMKVLIDVDDPAI